MARTIPPKMSACAVLGATARLAQTHAQQARPRRIFASRRRGRLPPTRATAPRCRNAPLRQVNFLTPPPLMRRDQGGRRWHVRWLLRLLRLLPAGAIAARGLHPLESAAFARRKTVALSGNRMHSATGP